MAVREVGESRRSTTLGELDEMRRLVASSTLVDISANLTCSRSMISPTRIVFQSLPANSLLPPLLPVGGLFNRSCTAVCDMLGCLCAILGDVGLALRFSAKLVRWKDGLDGVRAMVSLEGGRAMAAYRDGGVLPVAAEGDA